MNKFWIALGIVFIATVGAKAVVYLYCSAPTPFTCRKSKTPRPTRALR